MPQRTRGPVSLSAAEARRIWISAQRLDRAAPFGAGPEAVKAAVEHLGYVQIDTINVIERSHHHILWTRIPDYRREDLHSALSIEKSVFEYWTHALAYVPTRDLRFFLGDMQRHRETPTSWFGTVSPTDLRRIVARVRKEGALSIRDIDDDELVEKNHPWASRKPSKRALQAAFFAGLLTVSERTGMLKSYELADRHFGWTRRPQAASEARVEEYLLDRALTAQGIVSLDSICHLMARRKKAVAEVIERRVARRKLVPVAVEGAERATHWMARGTEVPEVPDDVIHLLSPFDPLVIQRKRLKLMFGYDHLFEAYLPREKRVMGYFALPVLVGDRIVAAIDLKTDRAAGQLLMQKWTWVGDGSPAEHKTAIEEALGRFERFQLAG